MSIVIGAFELREQAAAAVDQLLAGGFAADEVSVLGRHGEVADLSPEHQTATRIATGAGIGAALGGFGSIAVGLAALAIPGLGPVLALGPFALALPVAVAGGLAGGLVGFLMAQGVPQEEAERYAERVRAGAYLVAVHTDPSRELAAETILAAAGAEAPIRHRPG
ncbi:MAG TPA: general stress protein [Chloroflexota bacterium]|nr:general stress protein [Chloroflexota bacterium]